MGIEAVVFDVGETLVDETRQWYGWAQAIGVPAFTFSAVIGGMVASGKSHEEAFRLFGAENFELAEERSRRLAAGEPDEFATDDLYPDVREALNDLAQAGYTVAVAANQPAHREALLRQFGLPLDVILMSESLGAAKPSPEFFAAITRELGLPASEIAYVGDRLDNDVLPAVEAGMAAVFLRRGPWGYLYWSSPEASKAALKIESLSGLVNLLPSIP